MMSRHTCCKSIISATFVFALVSCAAVPENSGTAGILQSWTSLTSGTTSRLPTLPSFGMPGVPQSRSPSFLNLRLPTSISARDNEVYLIDAGLQRIIRYDRFDQSLTPFVDIAVGAETSIYVAPDRTIFVADPGHGRVLHYTRDGQELPALTSPGNLSRPVSIVMDEAGRQLLVADALYDHIVVFNSMGRPLAAIKPPQVKAVTALAQGPDGIYVLDRLAKRIVVMAPNGAFRYAFGEGSLAQPNAIAVDRSNLVFVADSFDQTVKIYRNGRLLETAGGEGAGADRFSGVQGLAVDGGMLYVADSLNARVQIMSIRAEAVDAKSGPNTDSKTHSNEK